MSLKAVLRNYGLLLPKPAQHPEELPELLALADGARSYLEVGVRHGGTFYEMMRRMPRGSRGVAVDLPGARWGRNSAACLSQVARRLRREGYDIHLIFGDSTDPGIIYLVHKLAPFDVALIDGDHLYSGVKKDWQNYGPMARAVIFHDIVERRPDPSGKRPPVEVDRLWKEIKTVHAHTREIIGKGSRMGLGVVYH